MGVWYCHRPGCGVVGFQTKGRPRKWCSEACRKTMYAAFCVDCGEETSGSEGRRKEPRCSACANRHVAGEGDRVDMMRAEARRARIRELWLEGRKLREIAEDIGTSVSSVKTEMGRMRRRGVELPRRR